MKLLIEYWKPLNGFYYLVVKLDIYSLLLIIYLYQIDDIMEGRWNPCNYSGSLNRNSYKIYRN